MNQATGSRISVASRVPLLALTLLAVPAASGADAAEATPTAYTETVRVTATRLMDDTELRNVPAHVTVIGREQIEASGATTLQELLAREAGIMVHDDVGNGVQTTVKLRGLGAGSATRVFLDGAPINDPRNNTLSLELISPASLERIEIIRGSAASLAGGGSQAGAIHLTTRRGTGEPAGSLAVSAGSFGSTRVGGEIGGARDRIDYFLSAQVEDTDGFRDNAGGDTNRFAATLGTDLAKGRRLELSALASDVEFGNPGALTAAEIAADRERGPFNTLDFTDQKTGQVALNLHGELAGRWSAAANLFYRDRSSEILTTGRSAPAYGGFFLDTGESSVGSTVQASHRVLTGKATNHLTLGLEWFDSEIDASLIATLPGALDIVDPANLSSDNTTERRTTAAFVQNTWQPADTWSVMLGLRSDRDRVAYDEQFPLVTNDRRRTFSKLSLRAGVNWNPGERYGYYASYSEAFLPPTVEQMYAFPTFGSNPDLAPEDSESWEIGIRLRRTAGPELDVALFVIDKENEIIFDPGLLLGNNAYPGANVNSGRTRREGVEATLRGRAAEGLNYYATVTLVDAEFRNGEDQGRTVPLVPGQQVSAGINADLSPALTLSVDALYVGRQVLDNDSGGIQPRLDRYAVFNARLAWQTGVGGRNAGNKGLELFVEGKNLFDEAYATRGIYAFDFSTSVNDTFLTPAPGRRYHAGARYNF